MLLTYDRTAPLAGKGDLEYTLPNNIKQYPAYGRELNELRLIGRIPQQRVMATTDWGLCSLYPRIVIPVGSQVNQLIFDYLTGLSVQIVHHFNESELVTQLTEAVLRIEPKTLVSFNIDVARQKDSNHSAFTLIYPETWEAL